MIILQSILTTFELSVIFKVACKAVVKIGSSLKTKLSLPKSVKRSVSCVSVKLAKIKADNINRDYIIMIDSRTWSFCLRHYIQKWSILLGRGKLDRRCEKGRQATNLASDLKNKINISCYTESQVLRLH